MRELVEGVGGDGQDAMGNWATEEFGGDRLCSLSSGYLGIQNAQTHEG
ncbi:MAG: hypothetical protein WBA10_04910 [Elainellaceae cyanobacterium]